MGHSANSPGRSSDRGYRERSRPRVSGAIPPTVPGAVATGPETILQEG
jgi:hypothetical protein